MHQAAVCRGQHQSASRWPSMPRLQNTPEKKVTTERDVLQKKWWVYQQYMHIARHPSQAAQGVDSVAGSSRACGMLFEVVLGSYIPTTSPTTIIIIHRHTCKAQTHSRSSMLPNLPFLFGCSAPTTITPQKQMHCATSCKNSIPSAKASSASYTMAINRYIWCCIWCPVVFVGMDIFLLNTVANIMDTQIHTVQHLVHPAPMPSPLKNTHRPSASTTKPLNNVHSCRKTSKNCRTSMSKCCGQL